MCEHTAYSETSDVGQLQQAGPDCITFPEEC